MADEEVPEDNLLNIKMSEAKLSENCTLDKEAITLR